MNGYQITFFTQQDRLIGKSPAGQWLIEEARRLGLRGATLSGAVEGLGHDGVIHAINLFDLSDQPVQVTVVVTEAEAEFFLEHLTQQQVKLFYVKVAAEFGTLGGGA
jgi:PII-like signaling protein